jgi:hypothetical protein
VFLTIERLDSLFENSFRGGRMTKSKLFFFLFVFIAFLLFSNNLSFAQISDTVGVIDTLRVGNSTAYPGSQVVVPVYAFNDEPLGAITVPLKFSNSYISCDSVSFVGTRVSDAPLRGDTIDNVNGTVKFYAFTFSQINPGNGLVADLFFRVSQDASPQTVEIDTFSTLDPFVFLDFAYTFSVDMTPAFAKGGITIKEKNLPPQIKPIGAQYVVEGDTLLIKISASDPEGDSLRISMLNCPDGASFVDWGDGRATFQWVPPFDGPWSSVNSPFEVIFVASDGINSSREDVEINVIDKSLQVKPYALEVGTDSGFFSNTVSIPITLVNADSVGRMKLLLHFDPSALSLLSVSNLNTRIDDWEFFKYIVDQPAIGDVQILAQADILDTAVTKPIPPGEGVIANLNLQIKLDPTPLSLFTDIRFKFADSTDNTFGGLVGQKFISQDKISYVEGGVLIRRFSKLLGDINLNGIPYEIGDAVLFSKFLIDPVKYPFNSQQELNSDVNEDGICCTLADFIVLLNRILEGGNPVLAKLVSQSDKVQLNLKENSLDIEMNIYSRVPVGGALLVIKHPGVDFGEPVLSSDAVGMALLERDNAGELRLLIYSPEAKFIESGQKRLLTIPIQNGNGNIEIEKAFFSDYSGNLIQAAISLEKNQQVPERFSLFQNYPNPFNPETNISFSLPEESQVSLKIYNLKGQLVSVLVNNILSAGTHFFKWDGRDESGKDVSSGIYFYKLIAGEYSEAKKMVKIK